MFFMLGTHLIHINGLDGVPRIFGIIGARFVSCRHETTVVRALMESRRQAMTVQNSVKKLKVLAMTVS